LGQKTLKDFWNNSKNSHLGMEDLSGKVEITNWKNRKSVMIIWWSNLKQHVLVKNDRDFAIALISGIINENP
jgi:hypothetical protein